MKRKSLVILACVLALALGVGVGAYATGTFGTQNDPLITKSYLEQVVQPELEKEVRAAAEEAKQTAASVAGTFNVVSLSAGQKLTCNLGAEFLLRSGSASALGGLSDITEGSAVNGGVLKENHLYMVAELGAGLRADGSVTLLVTGDYSIN